MVKVATTLDVPIKLLWPKSMLFSTERGFTMLGLGDIVVPGMFVATALRYDYYRASRKGSGAPVQKTYFYAALVAYAFGLITTMSVMHFLRKAQPALLYLRCVSHPLILRENVTENVVQSCLYPLILHHFAISRRVQ